MDTKPSTHCPSCRTPLDHDSDSLSEGLCPRCLLELTLHTAIDGESDSSVAPPLEDVSAAFPELDVIELIGRGGMGTVYKARQKSLDRLVALKLLPLSLAADPEFTKRFEAEARALAALNHPNIVTVHEFGQKGDFYFLLMEYVDGPNLRNLLVDHRMTPEEALAIVPPLCGALEYAHKRSIVHCDIKPENLLLNTDGEVKIADFGIARILGQSASDEEAEKTAGTPAYMAPEQIESPNSIDTRADIYSLGVVFYEMLTGERPNQDLTPPSGKNPSLDVRLDGVVLRALEANPNIRWQSANELNSELQTILTAQLGEPKVTPPTDLPLSTPLRAWIAAALAVIAVAVIAIQFFAQGQVTPVSEAEHQAAMDRYLDHQMRMIDLRTRFDALERKPQRTPIEEKEKQELWEQVSEGFTLLELYGQLRGVNQRPSVTTGSRLITILCVALCVVSVFLGRRHLSWLRGQQEPLPALVPGMIGALFGLLLFAAGIILSIMMKLSSAAMRPSDLLPVGVNTVGIALVILGSIWVVRRTLSWTRNYRRAPSFSLMGVAAIVLVGLAVAVPLNSAKQGFVSTIQQLASEASELSDSHQKFIGSLSKDPGTPQEVKLEEARREVANYARKAQEYYLFKSKPIRLMVPQGSGLIASLICSPLALIAAFMLIRKNGSRHA